MRPGAGAGAGAGDLPLAGPDPTPRSCAGLQPGAGAGDAGPGPAAVSAVYLPLTLSILIHVRLWTAVANPHLSLAEIKRVGVGQRTVRAAVAATKLRPSIFNRRNLHKYLCLVKDECLGRY